MDTQMEIGNLYRVTYKQQSGNGRWQQKQMTAVYLGWSKPQRAWVFSLRPVMGSTSLYRDHNPIDKVELIERDIPHKYRNGVRDQALAKLIKLPISLGYIAKPE